MDFISIVKSIVVKKAHQSIEKRLCPDQYVGLISSFTNHLTKDFSVRASAEERPENIPCLIMILESPHVDEFKGPPAPAKGKTGYSIRKHFLSVKELADYSEYGLILINAVQNQCSLGYPTSRYRDNVFISAWRNGANNSFSKRLRSVYRDGDVILNCCTKGKVKNKELRRLVQESIPTDLGIIIRRTHPSSWYSPRNRKSEWKLTKIKAK